MLPGATLVCCDIRIFLLNVGNIRKMVEDVKDDCSSRGVGITTSFFKLETFASRK